MPEPELIHEQILQVNWQGPTPPPAAVREYEALFPGAAAIIFGQFQAEGDHRRDMERQEQQRLSRGQLYAVLFALCMFGLTGFAISKEAYVLAGIFGSTTIVGGIVAFLGAKVTKAQP